MRWGRVRVVTTGWRRVVTTLLAQLKLLTIGADAESLTGAGANDDDREMWLTKISSLAAAGLQEMRPDEGARVNELGDVLTGINRADSASVKSVEKIVRQAASGGKSCARIVDGWMLVASAFVRSRVRPDPIALGTRRARTSEADTFRCDSVSP
jgi:hypothetical protein